VYASYGTVDITGTTISANPCNYDMVYNGIYSKMTLTGCTISGGSSPSVGGFGVSNLDGQLTLVDCTVEDFLNGGVIVYDGCVQAFNSRIIDNGGGGLRNYGNVQLTGCTISGDTAGNRWRYGAAGVSNLGSIALTDCTISGNRATPANGTLPGAVV